MERQGIHLTLLFLMITSNKANAESFNKFFLSHSNIDETNAQLSDDNDFPEGLDTIVASVREVYDLIKTIDPSKATGPDRISPRLLHKSDVSIVPSLTWLVNLLLVSAKVPSIWKLSHMIPLFKKDETSDTTNYRPVSLLSRVSNILE